MFDLESETMDNKSWLWQKKSSEKTIITTNKFGISAKNTNEEIQKPPVGNEAGRVKAVRILNEKLASVLLDSCSKDEDHVVKQENPVEEHIPGQETTKEEVISLKKELDEATKHGDVEFEKRLEEKLTEMGKRLADLVMENNNLSNVLLLKEKLIEELRKRESQTKAEFDTLMSRLDSTEKENAFLKYEFQMLEKELEFRTEELEYTRRSAEASHRQQLESIRKITMLESECQRLRVFMQKKLPGPIESRRKLNPTRDLVLRDSTLEKSPEIPVRNINFLIEQLCGMEEENKALKGVLSKKNAELRSSRLMYSRTASRLSQIEAQKCTDLVKCSSPVSTELYPIAGFDTDDGVGSSGSWANALMPELEHFRDAKLKSTKVSDISLMDDFAEMERLAIVSAGKELALVKETAMEKSFDWLQEVLTAIFKQQRISKRTLTELLRDIKIALGYTNLLSESDVRKQDSHKCNLEEENRRLLDEMKNMESERKDMDVQLQSATDKIENLTLQLQESEESIRSLQFELETTKAAKGMIEDQMENQKAINEDLDTQLTVARAKLNEVLQKISSLEVELEEKSNCCEELEATCLELQLQLESVTKRDFLNYNTNEEEAQTRNGLEITAASLKLAECQETILNLGKQLKALATPREAALFDKVFNTTSSTTNATINKTLNKRFSLRDQMVAEDSAKAIILHSPTKDATTGSDNGNVLSMPEGKFDSKINTPVGSLAIVPSKKQGGLGLIRRLLTRRKRGSSKKSQSLGKV